MNEIRKNDVEERIIFKAKCKMPTVLKVILGILIGFGILNFLIGLIANIVMSSLGYSSYTVFFSVMIGFGIVLSLFSSIYLLICSRIISRSFCLVTNKNIRGINAGFLIAKNYSYRLDRIDNVEVVSSIGFHRLVLIFDQGYINTIKRNTSYHPGTIPMGGGVFIIRYLANPTEVFTKLSDLLGSIKTDKDVQVDIEMKKIEVEEKKADALAKIISSQTFTPAQTSTKSNYIDELKSLKELLDSGIINQEEFDKKKKELLWGNSKDI